MKKILLIFFAFFVFNISNAQYSTLGTDFWVTWKQNFATPTNCMLFITSGTGATGTITMPGTGWSQNFTVAANGSVSITIPAAQNPCVETSNTVLNRAVRVVADNPIAVYSANQRQASTDASLVLPVVALGDEYMIMSYTVLSTYPSQFIVVGIENNTSVQITPKAAVIGGVGANVPFNITLNAGQVYLVQSNGDLTGSTVKATTLNQCNNFAVFAGNRCANVNPTCGYCDHLFEQMIPTKAWGSNYATAPLLGRNGDQFRILAMENGTTVNINGGAGIPLNEGQFHETLLTQASFITSDKPIAVAHYSRGQNCDGADSDPFMIMLSPVEQFIDHIVFYSFLAGNVNTLATNFITKTANTGLVTLDGAAVTGWATIPANPAYSFKRQTLTQGSHTLHSDSGVVAIVYGYGNVESYGYLAGANVQPLDVGFFIIVDTDTIAYNLFTDTLGCNQNTVSFTIDPTAQITNISWDFGDGTTALGSPVTHSYPNAGTYTITFYFERIGSCVLDSLQMQVVISSDLPPLNLPNDTVFCDSSAIYTLDATTTGATSYLWQDNSTNPVYTVTTSGTYSVTVSDAFNCTSTGSVTVEYIDLQLTTSSTNVSCLGANDGTASVTASGGHQPYSYQWNTAPPSNTQNVTDLPAGTYIVTVTENNGCTASASVDITDAGTMDVITDITDISCYGLADGSVSVVVTGGTPPYSYEWNTVPVQNTATANNLNEGSYTLTITDSQGCSATETITIQEPDELIPNTISVSPSGCWDEPGEMTAGASGGTLPYSFTWNTSPVQNTPTASNLPAGTYTVTITDQNGCTAINNATYSVIELSFSHTPENCGQNDGTATVSVIQSTGNYSITWNTGANDATIINLPSGTYSVTVTDDNGSCIKTVFVSEIQGPYAAFTAKPNPATVEEDLISFYNQSTGATSWLWNFGDGNYSGFENPFHTYYEPGTYTIWLIVTDNNNCVDSTSRIIIIRDIFTFYVPNAFTPNGDGINDFFMPFGLNPDTDYYKMSIYNRWGEQVFQTNNINAAWDGSSQERKKVIEKTDVYTYVIEVRDNRGIDRVIRGVVTLIH
jgi:gliding motility-associated-like protein